MAAFFSDVAAELLTHRFLNRVQEKYHYGSAQRAELYAVAREMSVPVQKEAFWEHSLMAAEGSMAGAYGAAYEQVVMSLGKGLDMLQESYDAKEMLLQSYMLEVLASELLLRGYEAYNCFIKKSTGWHVAGYHFPGSEDAFPLEALPDMLKNLTQRVSCNQAYGMTPKMSTVFIAELTQDETVQCEGVCTGCGSVSCPNRIGGEGQKQLQAPMQQPLTYGYGRIFGVF